MGTISKMKTYSLALVLLFCTAASTEKKYDNYKLLKLTPTEDIQVKFINLLSENTESSLDFWNLPAVNQSVNVLVKPSFSVAFKQVLELNKIQYETINENIQSAIDGEKQSDNPSYGYGKQIVGTFARYNDMMEFLDNVERQYPNMAKVSTYGYSSERRALKAIKLSSGKARYSIIIDAGIHAREWISQATAIWLIFQITTQYGKDAKVTNLLDTVDIYIIPTVNPDGYEYSHTRDRLWRTTRTKHSHGSRCVGADPNRNFDFPVFGGEGTSSSPCSQIYKGPYAFSEPCAAGLRDFLLSHNKNALMYLTMHSYGQYVLIPWGFGSKRPADYRETDSLAYLGGNAMNKVNGHYFTVGNTATTLYPAAGGSDDWAKGTAGIKYSYTIELFPGPYSRNGFITSQKNIIPSGREVIAGIFTMVDEIKKRHIH